MSRLRRIIAWLPRDMSLSEEEFRSRHRAMTGMLILHVPVLFAYGFLGRGFAAVPLAVEVAFPLVAALLGAVPVVRRSVRTFAVTTGLIYSSVALLHLTGGAAEASLHFLIVLAFVFLYRDWFLFLWAIVLMGSSYKLLELTQGALGDAMVTTGTPEMALWALMAAASIASVGLILAWKSAENSHRATIAALETARERDEAAGRRDAYSKMYVNLARRSQSLVDRQLAVIDELEHRIEDPDVLAGVFELDHLTTRVRRNGESLLVVADVDLPTRSSQPVPLSDIVRGAQSEIEQYRRVDARIDPSITVEGPVTRDLVHLLAELLDNATTYSPPSTTVKVHARAGDGGSVVLTLQDRGLGLTTERLAQANSDLQDTDALDENSIRHLGLRVIARLADKHEIAVRLTSTNGGGVTAWVQIPEAAVASADTDSLAPARLPETLAMPGVESPEAEAPPRATPGLEEDLAATPAIPAAPAGSAPMPPTPVTTPPAAAESAAPPAAPPDAPPAAPSAPTARPAPVSPGFSANGRGRRGRRSRSPVSTSHDRGAAVPRSTPRPPPPASAADGATAAPSRPPSLDQPLPVRSIPPPGPEVVGTRGTSSPDLQVPPRDADGSVPPPAPRAAQPRPAPSADDAVQPPLPRRQRGATQQDAKEEALDLFGELEAGAGRSSLGDFQRGQESARRGARG